MAQTRPQVPANPGRSSAGDDALHDPQVTLDSIGDAVLCTDLAGHVTYLNPVAERMTGWTMSEAVGRPLQEVMRIVDAESRKPVPNPLGLAMQCDTTASVSENSLLIGRDGRESPIEDTAAPIHDRNGKVSGAVIVFHDVGVARALSLRMSHLAQHDVLTGLPNRMLWADRLDQAIAAANRRASSLAVLFLDLDYFKVVNDRLGHAAGDQVLQSVARRLVASVRRSDTVSRHGGDEFLVLLSEVTCVGDAALSAAKLRAAISAPQSIDGRTLCVTASVGISVYPADGLDAATLVRKADFAALYAKTQRPAWPPRSMIAATDARAAANPWDGKQTPGDLVKREAN